MFVYAGIVELLNARMTGAAPMENMAVLRYAFYAISVSMFFVVRIVRQALLTKTTGDTTQTLIGIMDAPIVVPDIVFDGDWNPDDLVGGSLPAALRSCVRGNGDADWAVLDVPNDYAAAALDPTELECERAALPKVTIPGVE